MGIDLYNCEICKEPFTQFGGGTIQTCCFCNSWVCFTCIDEDSKYRNHELDEKCCPICDKIHNYEEEVIDKSKEELKNIIDDLYFKKRIGNKLHNKLMDLINIISI